MSEVDESFNVSDAEADAGESQMTRRRSQTVNYHALAGLDDSVVSESDNSVHSGSQFADDESLVLSQATQQTSSNKILYEIYVNVQMNSKIFLTRSQHLQMLL